MRTNEFEIEFDVMPNEFEIEFDGVQNEFEIEFESAIQEVYPELEDLKVTPSTEEQIFKAEKYGYETVIVDKIPTKYVVPQVENKILILSRGEVEGGVLAI